MIIKKRIILRQVSDINNGISRLLAVFLINAIIIVSTLLVNNCYARDLGTDYIDKGDGTIQDKNLSKTWMKIDSYNDLKSWINLNEAKDYTNEVNKKKRGGFSDWRLPSRDELKSLFNEKHQGKKTFDKSEILWISDVFNFSYCYFWTNEKIDDEYVWQTSLCNGKAYKTGKNNGPGNSAVLIRP